MHNPNSSTLANEAATCLQNQTSVHVKKDQAVITLHLCYCETLYIITKRLIPTN
jgi:hypothetical protein